MEEQEAFVQTTSDVEQNFADFDSNQEFVVDLISEKFRQQINKSKSKLNLRYNLLRRDQDLNRIFGEASSSEEGSSFSGTSLEKQFSNESGGSKSDKNDDIAVEQKKMERSLEKDQDKKFEMDRINNYVDYQYNDTVNTTGVAMLISNEDLRFGENEEIQNTWFRKRAFFSSSLLEDVAEEPISFMDERDDLGIVGEVTINRISFKSLKQNSKNNFVLIVNHGTNTNIYSLPKNTKFEKNGTINFLDPIKLNLVDGFDVTLKFGCTKSHEKDVMGQLKSYLKSIKKHIGIKDPNNYTKLSKYFKLIGICGFNILNSKGDNVMKFCKTGKNIVHPLVELDIMDNNIKFTGVTTGYLDVATKLDNIYRWEKLWCVLDGYNFKYYQDELEDDLRGSIRLWKNERFEKKVNSFVPNHDFIIIDQCLAAHSKELMIKWQNKLNLALLGQKCWSNAKTKLSFYGDTEDLSQCSSVNSPKKNFLNFFFATA